MVELRQAATKYIRLFISLFIQQMCRIGAEWNVNNEGGFDFTSNNDIAP